MIKNELYKMFIKQKGVIFIIVLMIVKIVTLSLESPLINYDIEDNKSDYLSYLEGKTGYVTSETQQKITQDYSNITNARIEYSEFRSKYVEGEIDADEYYAKVDEVNPRLSEATLIDIAYREYENTLEFPAKRYLMYNNGWESFIGGERVDWALLILLAFLIIPLFCRDHETNSHSIISTTLKGKRRLCYTKQLIALFSAISFSVIFYALEALFFEIKYGLPNALFPIQSVYAFRESIFNLNILQTTLLIGLLKMVGVVMFVFILILISVLVKKFFPSMIVSALIIVIPYIVFFNGLSGVLKYSIPMLGLLVGNGYFRGASEYVFEGSAVIMSGFQGVDSIYVYLSILLSFITIVVCCFAAQVNYADKCKFSKYRISKNLSPLAVCAIFCAVSLYTVYYSSKEIKQEYNAEYNTFMSGGDSDEDYIYLNFGAYWDRFKMIDKTNLEEIDVIRDPRKSIDDFRIFYSDKEFVYYLLRDNTFGRNRIYQVDKNTYFEKLVYTEKSGTETAQEGKTRFLGTVNLYDYDNTATEIKDSQRINSMWVDGEHLFLADTRYVYMVNLKTSKKEVIIDELRYLYNISYYKGMFYYANNLHEVYSFDLTTRKREKLNLPKAQKIFTYEGEIYFLDGTGKIGKYNANEDSYLILSESSVTDWNYITPHGNYLYFVNTKSVLCRVNVDTAVEETFPDYGKVYNSLTFDGFDYIYMTGDNYGGDDEGGKLVDLPK